MKATTLKQVGIKEDVRLVVTSGVGRDGKHNAVILSRVLSDY
jgi:hypothetical protein